jgi:hypothetical protein
VNDDEDGSEEDVGAVLILRLESPVVSLITLWRSWRDEMARSALLTTALAALHSRQCKRVTLALGQMLHAFVQNPWQNRKNCPSPESVGEAFAECPLTYSALLSAVLKFLYS